MNPRWQPHGVADWWLDGPARSEIPADHRTSIVVVFAVPDDRRDKLREAIPLFKRSHTPEIASSPAFLAMTDKMTLSASCQITCPEQYDQPDPKQERLWGFTD
jgi:hypothetical protein